MNKQLIFETVATKLLEQGCPSLHEGNCAYRGEGGRRCGIGWLIPDENYDEGLEGFNAHIDEVIGAIAGVYEVDRREDTEFLVALQEIHDLTDENHWLDMFKTFAAERGLDDSFLEAE